VETGQTSSRTFSLNGMVSCVAITIRLASTRHHICDSFHPRGSNVLSMSRKQQAA
jgi:hypothetical protein